MSIHLSVPEKAGAYLGGVGLCIAAALMLIGYALSWGLLYVAGMALVTIPVLVWRAALVVRRFRALQRRDHARAQRDASTRLVLVAGRHRAGRIEHEGHPAAA